MLLWSVSLKIAADRIWTTGYGFATPKNNLVVGTQARILYQDALGRMNIALRFNEMVRRGEVGPIMLGRDHHDVSGTDSPSGKLPISRTAAM